MPGKYGCSSTQFGGKGQHVSDYNDVLFAVDGNNHLHADWYAGKEWAMRNFTQRLQALRDTFNPGCIAVAFDIGRSFRHDLSSEYKAGRQSKPEELIGLLRDAPAEVEKLGFSAVSVDGYEADNVVASMVRQFVDDWKRAVIVSNDHDYRQLLIEGKVTILRNVRRQPDGSLSYDWYTATKLAIDTGLLPSQYVDYTCLTGDSTDNIRGARGIGPKTARQLLRSYGNLQDVLYAGQQWRLPMRQKRSLSEFAGRAELVRRLVRLVDNVRLPDCWEAADAPF